MPSPPQTPELLVADAIGRVMAFWGFRKNLGRIWALLYLSPDPLTSADLCEQLRLSTGSVSMALTELQRWGAVRKRFVPGDRRDHYEVEEDIWGTVTRVMEQREGREIETAVQAFVAAEEMLSKEQTAAEAAEDEVALAAGVWRRDRIGELEELALAARDLLKIIVSQGSPDAIAPLAARSAADHKQRMSDSLLKIPKVRLDD